MTSYFEISLCRHAALLKNVDLYYTSLLSGARLRPYPSHAVDFTLLSEPLIPLPDELLLLPMPVPMRPQPSPGGQPPLEPIASVDPSLVALSREGPFVANCEPGDTGGHPLISTGLPVCPYRMTTYREEDVAHVDPTFGVQIHHPRFLKCMIPIGPGGPGLDAVSHCDDFPGCSECSARLSG